MGGKASLVKGRWTPQAAGGIPMGFAITARHTAGGWNPSASLCSAPPFDKGGFIFRSRQFAQKTFHSPALPM